MKNNNSLGKVFPVVSPAAALRLRSAAWALLFCALPLALAQGAKLKEARVTQVIRDVKLLPGQAAPRPATISDQVREGTAVRTGLESRAELTFTDATLARLGANTIFSFDQGTRNLELGGGAMLLRVPKNAGGAQINTAAITAAITGTTMLIEYHPDAYCKYIMLEGVARIFRKNAVGESVLLHAGQMLIVNPNGKGLPEPVDVDLDLLMKTSLLITGFGPLPSSDLIAQAISAQDAQKKEGNFIDTNLVLYNGTIVSLLDPTYSGLIDQATNNETRQPPSPPPSTVTPPPNKFQPPTTITSSTPYVIDSGTVIQTDPSITTNGVTDFGVIYQGIEIDGPFSSFAFGATSNFDTTSGFDAQIDSSGAVFVFTALQLAGNPTISTTNGETNLALIGVNGITSGGPGGVLTFAGLNGLLLATVDGSITLGSEISFEGLNDLTFYARGAGSSLTLGCDITTLNQLNLYSEGDVNLSGAVSTGEFFSFSNGDFNFTGSSLEAQTVSIRSIGDVNLASGAPLDFNTTDFLLEAGGDINADNSLEITQTNEAGAGSLVTDLLAGGDIDIGGSLTLVTDNSNGRDLASGADIALTAGGDINVGSDLILNILNNDGGHIGGDALISIVAGGDLTANAIDLLINNRSGGTIDLGATVSISLSGALTTTGDVSLVISNRDDGGGGGTGEQSNVSLSAERIDIGGTLTEAISANAGTNLVFASGTLSASTDLITGGGLNFSIQNGGATPIGFLGGGTMGDAVLELVAGGTISTGDFLAVLVSNVDGGEISNNADIFVLAGSIDAQGPASFKIINSTFVNNLHSLIGGDAGIALTAQSLFSSDTLLGSISNEGGGIINGHALLDFTLTGASESIGDTTFQILNEDDDSGYGGGTIGGDATISVTAGSLAAADLITQINNAGGSIGGDSSINFVIGEFAIPGDATFEISNGLGTITGDASVFVDAVNITTGGFFQPLVNNTNGSIGGSASVAVDVTDDINVGAETFFNILNSNGAIGGDAQSDLFASNFSSGSTFEFQILNDGGSIGSNASLFASMSGGLTIEGDATIQITNGGGSIGQDATIDINLGSFAANSLLLQIDNSTGFIGGTSDITFATDGDLTINNGGALTANFLSDFGGQTVNGGNVSLNVGGDLVAGSLTANVFTRFGGIISSGGSIFVNVTGDVTTTGGVVLFTLDQSGGIIGGDQTVSLDAASVSAAFILLSINSRSGGEIDGNALVSVNTPGDLVSSAGNTFQILNDDGFGSGVGGTITGDATVLVNAANISFGGSSLNALIFNQLGGIIGGSANLDLSFSGSVTDFSSLTLTLSNSAGTIGGDASITLSAGGNLIGGDTFIEADIDNQNAGLITGDALLAITAADISGGSLDSSILNSSGAINGDAVVSLNAANVTLNSPAGFFVESRILNDSGTIGGDAVINLTATSLVLNSDFGIVEGRIEFDGGSIGGDALINYDIAGSLSATTVSFFISNDIVFGGGIINGSAGINVNSGSISAGSLLAFIDSSASGAPGTINSDATITFNAASVSATGSINIKIFNEAGGFVGNDALIALNLGDTSVGADITPQIWNFDDDRGFGGGTIGGDASVSVTAGNLTAGSLDLDIINGGGSITGDATLEVTATSVTTTGGGVFLQTGDESGSIGGNALLQLTVLGDLAATGDVALQFFNSFGTVTDATINLSAASLTANSLSAQIFTDGGDIDGNAIINLTANDISAETPDGFVEARINFQDSIIGGDATINLVATNSLTTTGQLGLFITEAIPPGGGDIVGAASINLTAGNITAGSVMAVIDETSDGTIEGNSTITSNITETLTATNDATFDLNLISSPGAITFNGGTYEAGGTLHSTINGADGGITISSATMHADILKIGALGTNGTLTIGGGSLSADTTLKLYAGGSNGTIDFVANVTLSSPNDIVIIAANTVTIENGVVVTTFGSDNGAAVYTNVPNYTGSGGNGSKTGMFAGDGTFTSPFDQAPPFDDPDAPEAPATGSSNSAATSGSNPTTDSGSPADRGTGASAILPHRKQRVPIARVADSNELLALLDKFTSSPTEAGHGGSNATTGKTGRGAGSVSLGKGGSSTQNLDRANMALNRSGAPRPAALP